MNWYSDYLIILLVGGIAVNYGCVLLVKNTNKGKIIFGGICLSWW